MGRKASNVVVKESQIIDLEQVHADMNAAHELGLAEKMVMDFEEPLRQLGQLEAFEFMKRVSDVAIAQVFENIKNSGKYKNLPYKDEAGNLKYVSDLEEFCQAKLGKTYRRCYDLSQNLRVLGPELYEQSERLGLRNIDYKALRALPAEDRALVRKAIEETHSRDEVLDLLQEMAAKHQREKEALTKEAEEARLTIADKDAVIVQKTAKLEKLVEAKNRREVMTDAEQQAELERDLAEATLVAVGDLQVMRKRINDIRTIDHLPQGLYTACANALQRMVSEAMSIAYDYGIELMLAAEPADNPNAGEDASADWLEQSA